MRKPGVALEKRLDEHHLWVVTKGAQGTRLVEHGGALRGMDLSRRDLRQVDFSNADLRGSDFNNSEFRRATLYESDFSESDLRGVDMCLANLRGSLLIGADMRDSNIRFSVFSKADLRKADLRGTDLTNTITEGTILPATDKIIYLPVWKPHMQRDLIRIGCQCHQTDEWESFTNQEIASMHPLALDWWREHRDLILTTARECEPYPE